jgi:hypothetical protein
MLHPNSPQPHPHRYQTLISPLNSPTPNIFVVTYVTGRSLPPLLSAPDLEPHPIPYPLLSPVGENPSPFRSHNEEGSRNKEGVASLLSGLQFSNQSVEETILSHAQSVANLETQARRHEQLIRHHELTI